jgi:hypothetical protein
MILTNTEFDKLKHARAQIGELAPVDATAACQKLKWASGLNESDDSKTVAGMLAVLVQFKNSPEPAIAAAQWRITKDIVDDQNRPGQLYYDIGYNALNE